MPEVRPPAGGGEGRTDTGLCYSSHYKHTRANRRTKATPDFLPSPSSTSSPVVEGMYELVRSLYRGWRAVFASVRPIFSGLEGLSGSPRLTHSSSRSASSLISTIRLEILPQVGSWFIAGSRRRLVGIFARIIMPFFLCNYRERSIAMVVLLAHG